MRSQKVRSLSGVDYISALPDNLIENILLKLPLRDAARTCILSTKWRHSWVKLPVLRLDSELFEQSFDSFQTESQTGDRAKFAMIISHILALHQGPITDFKLDICQLEGSPEVDSLIRFISRSKIKTFFLQVGRKEKYKLPSSIFTCVSLIKLHLRNCEIPRLPSTFKGFNRLENITLLNVNISSQQLQYIVSNSPSLWILTLITPVNILHLGINSPSLTDLIVVQRLQTTNYAQQEESVPSTSNPFGGLPSLRNLCLNSVCVRSLFAGGVPTRLLTLSADIKTLTLFDLYLGKEIQLSCVLWLLKSIPDLRKFDIYRLTQSGSWNVNLEEEEDYSDISFNSLEEVTMNDAVGRSLEMKLIEQLLAKSPSLRKMSIKLATSKLGDSGLNFFKEMSMFKRAASNVEVHIVN